MCIYNILIAAAVKRPPASPRAAAKLLKRNPSFWDSKKKNQLTLRRYTDVGITTVMLNVSGTYPLTYLSLYRFIACLFFRFRLPLFIERKLFISSFLYSLLTGTRFFATTTNTLLREPDTLFVTILEREELAIRNGKHIFLDRNPKYFSSFS